MNVEYLIVVFMHECWCECVRVSELVCESVGLCAWSHVVLLRGTGVRVGGGDCTTTTSLV